MKIIMRKSSPFKYVMVFILLISAWRVHAVEHDRKLRHIQAKAELVKQEIIKRSRRGVDVSMALEKMEDVKTHLDGRRFAEADALLDQLLLRLRAGTEVVSGSKVPTTDVFKNPQRVKIRGYDGGAMEPFITRDGKFLLFNSAANAFGARKGNRIAPDLHFARRMDSTTFEYAGKIEGANSDSFDGGPTLDKNNRLYFSSPREYEKTYEMLYSGQFEDGKVTEVELITGNVSKRKGGWLDMDSEISADGRTPYFTDNRWNTKHNVPKSSNMGIAKLVGDKFVRTENSGHILRNINTKELDMPRQYPTMNSRSFSPAPVSYSIMTSLPVSIRAS